ncbi:hypothetical protein OG729_36450 [Streptomyces sp. NBC_00210]|uniref:hypothetical protein n=1 Tax=unclassified Streptomyces TaxID=2593676 RepID=UPI003245D5F7
MTRPVGRSRRRLFEREAEPAAAGLRPRRLRAIETEGITARERSGVVPTAAEGREKAAVAALHLDEQCVTRLLAAGHRRADTDEAGLADALRDGLAEGMGGGHGR